ncbi:MAG: hypothetical protein CL626_05275 [Aurantimonas sp.]|nr:hypothetical protein [Aurantimonas sp.]
MLLWIRLLLRTRTVRPWFCLRSRPNCLLLIRRLWRMPQRSPFRSLAAAKQSPPSRFRCRRLPMGNQLPEQAVR